MDYLEESINLIFMTNIMINISVITIILG